jgi:hypothetical protein
MAQVGEHLPIKHGALSSISLLKKKRKKERKKEKI